MTINLLRFNMDNPRGLLSARTTGSPVETPPTITELLVDDFDFEMEDAEGFDTDFDGFEMVDASSPPAGEFAEAVEGGLVVLPLEGEPPHHARGEFELPLGSMTNANPAMAIDTCALDAEKIQLKMELGEIRAKVLAVRKKRKRRT
ncbi:hypothetical protein BBJ29_002662 [Phytophthora kernoviae]|uniref:Uncharacterized protein n=1 Tax=Phytophthora kernoviae TaxID=325452 RepID=A0A3F2RWA0_9STRA|nr:hypothetical protein BBJ29_002662 [Phytophthora kernoviae]RLN64626.1 hypothetical protein BBP00_00003340 [Phytophthora kernoviae]